MNMEWKIWQQSKYFCHLSYYIQMCMCPFFVLLWNTLKLLMCNCCLHEFDILIIQMETDCVVPLIPLSHSEQNISHTSAPSKDSSAKSVQSSQSAWWRFAALLIQSALKDGSVKSKHETGWSESFLGVCLEATFYYLAVLFRLHVYAMMLLP